MTDVREVEFVDVVDRTGRNEVGPAQGRDLRAQPSRGAPALKALARMRTGIRWRPLLMLLLFLSPALLTAGYYGMFATDRYVSSAEFIVRTASKPVGGSGLGLLLKMTGLSRSEDDTYSVQNFILSRDAVRQLQETLPLAEMYGRAGVDAVSRYPSVFYGKTNEELFKYFTKMTAAIYSSTTGVTTLEVQAFRPDDAQAIATTLLDLGERLVNELNKRIQNDAVSAAEEQVKHEEVRLTDAQVALTAFQNKESMIDPLTNSVQVSTVVGKLEGDLAQAQSRISDMKAGSPNNPGLPGLMRQAEATKAQIKLERDRITSSQEGLADKLGAYQRLVLEREFATKALATASASLDTARSDVRRKQLYIDRIVEPNLSDHATRPFGLWITFTVAVLNILGLFLCWLLFSGVKNMSLQLTEHRGFAFWRRALQVQRRVLVALMIRQLMTKYGRSNIGFLWIVLEPMILCSGVLMVRSLIQGGSENGVSLIALLVTGYLPLTLWRHLSSAGVFMLRRNGSMLYHGDISLIDCMIAHFILELGGCTIAAMIVYWALYTLGLIEPFYDVGLTISGWLLMGLLAFSVMVVFAVLTEYYEAAERFIQPFQYLFLPICGFFYMVAWLPSYAQGLAWYVPTVHCYEMVRAGLFGPSIETHYTPWYPILYSVLQLAWALPMIDKARNKIHFG